jgi:hypothetical protein
MKRGLSDPYAVYSRPRKLQSVTLLALVTQPRNVFHREWSSRKSAEKHSKEGLKSQKELTHTILLHPSYFGPRMLQFLESKLYSDVEGTCSGQFGYIIAVVSILDIGKGMVVEGTGQAEFVTRYRAIVFKPFKGEVVDGVVNNVNKVLSLPHSASAALPSSDILVVDGILCGCRPFDGFRVTPSTSAFSGAFGRSTR